MAEKDGQDIDHHAVIGLGSGETNVIRTFQFGRGQGEVQLIALTRDGDVAVAEVEV